jgi:hypothetical protein
MGPTPKKALGDAAVETILPSYIRPLVEAMAGRDVHYDKGLIQRHAKALSLRT